MKPAQVPLPQALLAQISKAITDMRFGHVQITIHNGQVVQIEKVEKLRLDTSAYPSSGSIQQPSSWDDRDSGSPRIAQGR